MKIVYLSACSQLGGAERALLDILASIRAVDTEHSLHVVTTEDGPLISACRALTVEATVLNMPATIARWATRAPEEGRLSSLLTFLCGRARNCRLLFLRLRRVISSIALKDDVLHTNGFKMHVLAADKADAVSLCGTCTTSFPAAGNAKVLGHLCGACSSRRLQIPTASPPM